MPEVSRLSTAAIDTVEAELPSLRRFARLLTGAPEDADALCVEALHRLLFRGESASETHRVRVALYGACYEAWSAVKGFWDGGEVPAESAPAPVRHLLKVHPGHRACLLLAHVAGLSDAEVAEILEIEPAFVRRLLATAESAVHDQMRTSVLIIEDESLVACDLSDIVREMDHEVVGIARTAAEAVEIAGRERPGLILADIRLADGSTSFEGLDQIARYGDIPTIFITAYPGEAVAVGHAAQGGSGQGGSGQGVSGQGGRGQGGRGPTGGLVLAKPFSTSAVKHSIAHTLFHSQLAS